MGAEFVLLGLQVLVPLIKAGFAGDAEAQGQADWVLRKILDMVAQDRDPTEEEWGELRAIRHSNHDKIQRA